MKPDLPPPLSDRTRVHSASRSTAAPRDAEFVLYWMRTAVRGHENPALDAAIHTARLRGLPVFVYHALSDRYPFASDRHHTFILEGARDVQAELAERGVGYAFHLERADRDRGDHLRALARRAAVVVTEDMPTRPLDEWTASLAKSVETPVWLVDTACLVPMRRVRKAPDRAFGYRDETAELRAAALRDTWVDAEHTAGVPFVPDLPFEPIDLQHTTRADLAELVAACRIDHTVGPVADTPGGSRAGYERWAAFVERGLSSYHKTRNDPLRRGGVSRMSAYLHYGQVSPFRIAREVYRIGGPGADKYLDELLVWREISYAYCFHRPDHTTLDAVPAWARETLAKHAADPRDANFSHETLARAKTGDALWDATQRSLLVHGELHNNLRMTWGKAFLQWTESPERALEMALDLNHRYALDGRDPASYGGILWCFGLFDRPFRPEESIRGTLRPRPTDQHAARLDVAKYAAIANRANGSRAADLRIAVVGAGLSGSVCARTLRDHGLGVEVFDKARGPAGRMSTRRYTDVSAGTFDHGAQYFTARDPRFRRQVASWLHDGTVAEWTGEVVALRAGEITRPDKRTVRYVGVPGMNALCRHLVEDLTLTTGFRVSALDRDGSRWVLQTEDGRDRGPFDAVVLAMPAPQAATLARPHLPSIAARLGEDVDFAPSLSTLLRFGTRIDVNFDGAFVEDSPLGWIARDSSKPGRPDGERWVLHATPEWSRAHFDDDPKDVAEAMRRAFVDAIGEAANESPEQLDFHRWAFALPTTPIDDEYVFDTELGLAMCGDWCAGPRVEGAYSSGAALAGRILAWSIEGSPASDAPGA